MMTCKHGNAATRPCDGCAAEARLLIRQEERDLAVIARIGGRNLLRYGRQEWGADAVRYAAENIHNAPRLYPATLPESAFDWPVYRVALAPLVDEWLDAHMDEQDG